MNDFEFIEHTADIGSRERGSDLKDVFKKAAVAMFGIIADKNPKVKGSGLKTKKISINVQSGNLEELFVDWLNELLSLSATKEMIFFDFQINTLNKNNLHAQATGAGAGNYKVNTEIKAATYHQLKLEETESGWQAEIIFDV